VVTIDLLDMRETELQLEIVKLRRRVLVLATVVRLLLALVRLSGARLDARSLHKDTTEALLGTIECAGKILQLRSILRVLGLSPARYHSWTQPDADCHPADVASCPRRVPNQLTAKDVSAIKDMVTSPEYRHVPTSRLAILAQRLGRVFAAPSTWAKLVRERGWRRPRLRIHPKMPMVGLRTTRPDEAWHLDTTVLRLLDGSKAYVHAVIDNFSRRILAFRVGDHFDVGNAIAVLMDAVRNATASKDTGASATPMLMVDGGIENYNSRVDELAASGLLRRVLAQTEVSFSNSLIEAFWRTMKHQWLFLNTLDSVAAVRRHVTFYVAAHNSEIPHAAFRGQTPDEMYFNRGADLPDRLVTAKKEALAARLAANRDVSCANCSGRLSPTKQASDPTREAAAAA
jgi:transposase InsO family protein